MKKFENVNLLILIAGFVWIFENVNARHDENNLGKALVS